MSEHGETAGSELGAETRGEKTLQRYRTLADVIDDGICHLDAEGRFVAVDDIVVETLGYVREELLCEHVSMLPFDDDAERTETRGDEFDRIDLETVFEDVRKNRELKIEETKVGVTVEPLPRVHGDRRRLRQVLRNPSSTAFEYHGDSPPRVRVSADRYGSEWEIAVRDGGPTFRFTIPTAEGAR